MSTEINQTERDKYRRLFDESPLGRIRAKRLAAEEAEAMTIGTQEDIKSSTAPIIDVMEDTAVNPAAGALPKLPETPISGALEYDERAGRAAVSQVLENKKQDIKAPTLKPIAVNPTLSKTDNPLEEMLRGAFDMRKYVKEHLDEGAAEEDKAREDAFRKALESRTAKREFLSEEDIEPYKVSWPLDSGEQLVEYQIGGDTLPEEVAHKYLTSYNDELLHEKRFRDDEEYRNNWFLQHTGITDKQYRENLADELDKELDKWEEQVKPTVVQNTRGGYAALGAAANQQHDSSYQIARKKLDDARAKVNTLRKNNFLSGLREGADLASILTFDLSSIGDNLKLMKALDKEMNGEPLTKNEEALIKAWEIDQKTEEAVEMLGGRSWSANVGYGVGYSLPYIPQLMLTGGVASAATKGISSAAAKAALKKSLATTTNRKIAEGLKLGALKVAENTVGSAARTPFMGMTYKDFTNRRLEHYSLERIVDGATGEVKQHISKEDSSALRDAFLSYGTTMSGVFSEGVGDWLSYGIKAAAKSLPRENIMRILAVDGISGPVKNPTMVWLKRASKINGVLVETAEEAIDDITTNVIAGDEDGWKRMATGQYWWELFCVSAILSGSFGAAYHGTNLFSTERKSRRALEKARLYSLDGIRDESLRKYLFKASMLDDLTERSKMLANIDWESGYTREDMARSVDFITAQTSLDAMYYSEAEADRLRRMMPALAKIDQSANDKELNTDDLAEILGDTYAKAFRTQENQQDLNRIADRVRVAANAGISARDINDILAQAGLKVYAPGDEVETLAGVRGMVNNVLPGAYEIIYGNGNIGVFSFEEVLQPSKEVAEAQMANADQEVAAEEQVQNAQPDATQQAVTEAVEAARVEAEGIKNLDDDVVYDATMTDGSPVHIIKGANIIYDEENGSIDYEASDAMVVVQFKDGSRKQVSTRKIESIDEAITVDEMANLAGEAALAAAEAAQAQEVATEAQPIVEQTAGEGEQQAVQAPEQANVQPVQAPEQTNVQPEQVAEQTVAPKPAIPTLKNGQPDYNAMTPEQFVEQYVTNFGEENTERIARNNIKEADKQISDLEKKMDTVTDPNKLPQLVQQQSEAKERRARYAAVLDLMGLSEDANATWKDRSTAKKKAETSRMASLFPDGLPNVEGFILADIATGGKIRWSDKVVNGTVVSRGLGAELGLADANSERARRIGLLAKDAPTPEEYAEQLRERLDAAGIRYDESELRDKVLDVYASVDTVGNAWKALEVLSKNMNQQEDGLDYEEEMQRRAYERERQAEQPTPEVETATDEDMGQIGHEALTETEDVPFSVKTKEPSAYDSITAEEQALFDKMAKALNVAVEYVDEVNGGRANAEYVPSTRTLRVARGGRDKVARFLVGHEFTHRMQALAPQQYEEFAQAVVDYLGAEFNIRVKRLREVYKAHEIKANTQLLRDEVVADFAGELAENEMLFDGFVNTDAVKNNPGLLERIMEVLRAIRDYFVENNASNPALDKAIGKLEALYSASVEAANSIELEGGQVDIEKGDALSSVKDILQGKQREKAIKDLMRVTGRSRATVERYLKAEESLAAIILDANNNHIIDLPADDSLPSIWKNSDYPQGTVEFSNICRKRLPLTMLYQRLQKEFPLMVFDKYAIETMRGVLKANGVDVACGICFVEDRRQLLGEIGQMFIDMLEGNFIKANEKQNAAFEEMKASWDGYIPSLYDLLTLDGYKALRAKHPAVATAFLKFNNARGMQAGRLFQAYSAYHREILGYSKATVRSKNNNGGLRIFSFSDFEAHHLIDLVQILTDCAAKGLKVQGYTKVPEFARAVKDTNMKVNRSLISKGNGVVDANYVPGENEAVSPNAIGGKRLLLDTVEGIDVNHRDFFDSTDSKSVGNILVGINEEQIRLAMLDPFVDYIIPFHTGLSASVLKQKGIGEWVNYKNSQIEKVEVDGKLKNAPGHGINIYEEVLSDDIKTERQFVNRYLEVCREKGYIPKFPQFLSKNSKGKYIYTKGYYKFLIDFKLFDKNGKIIPQEAIVPVFDNELNKQILEDYVRDEKAKLPNEELYGKVKEALDLPTQYSLKMQPEKKVTFDDFFENTAAVYVAQEQSPEGTPNYTSPSGSRYWYGEDEQGKYVIRRSDHWSDRMTSDEAIDSFESNPSRYRNIASCYWGIDTRPIQKTLSEVSSSDIRRVNYNSSYHILNITFRDGGSRQIRGVEPSEMRAYYESVKLGDMEGAKMVVEEVANQERNLAIQTPVVIYGKAYLSDFTKFERENNTQYSLKEDVASILEDYDTDGVEYSTIMDVADAVEALTYESEEDTSDLEQIVRKFRFDQEDARNWGYRMESGGEDEFESALRDYVADARYSIKDTPMFYSNAFNAVKGISQEKATPEQWLKMIEKSGGLKAGEDKWIGLSDWLKGSDKKTLTKQEVLDYIAQNEIRVEEVKYAEENSMVKTINESPEFAALRKEYFDLKAEIKDEAETKLREKYGPDFDIAFSVFGDLFVKDDKAAAKLLGIPYENADLPIQGLRLIHSTQGLTNKREIALTVPTIEPWNEGDQIHFGDAGEGRAVAWIRFGETTDSDGKRVLVIDEIQSKRHQEGREHGYATDVTEEQVKKAREEADVAFRMLESFDEQMAQKYGTRFWSDQGTNEEYAHWELLRSEYDRYGRIYEELYDKRSKAIPAAPFEKNWHELAIKRMLRYAAENGYDAIAWTKGDQQAERYNIGSVVQRITSYEDGDNRMVIIRLNNNEPLNLKVDSEGKIVSSNREIGANTLSDVVGKELAVKIMNNEGEDATYYNGRDIPAKVIAGDGLRIGGKGMRGFYDQILPSFINKYGKKWGVEVQDITLPFVEEAGRTMHSVDVTDAMRDSVMEGQPLFSIKQTPRVSFLENQADDAARAYVNEQMDIIDKMGTARLGERAYSFERMLARGGSERDLRAYEALTEYAREAISERPDKYEAHEYNLKDGEHGVEILNELFHEFNTSKETEQLFSYVYPAAKRLGISVRVQPMRNWGEHYQGIVALNGGFFNSDIVPDSRKAEVILHELIHSVTTNAIYFVENPSWQRHFMFQPNENLKAAVKNIKDIYNNIAKSEEFEDEYGVTNVHEFMAELSNPQFVEKLKKHNLWTEIVDAIKRIVSAFVPDGIYSSSNAHKEAMDALEKIVENMPTEKQVAVNYYWQKKRPYEATNGSQYSLKGDAVERAEIERTAKANGTWLKAPNGKQTNLPSEQWVTTRTKAFKNWAGDWENDPENATKILDENGEPKIVYHQTNATVYINRETGQNWDELDWRERMEWEERDDWEDYWEEQDFYTFTRVNARTTNEFDGFFFAPEYDEHHEYGNRTIAAFLNIRKPASNKDYNIDSTKNNAGREERIRLQEEGFDGVIRKYDGVIDEYIAFEPNQIKSAEGNTTFDPNDDDTRYSVKSNVEAEESADIEIGENIDAGPSQSIIESEKAQKALTRLNKVVRQFRAKLNKVAKENLDWGTSVATALEKEVGSGELLSFIEMADFISNIRGAISEKSVDKALETLSDKVLTKLIAERKKNLKQLMEVEVQRTTPAGIPIAHGVDNATRQVVDTFNILKKLGPEQARKHMEEISDKDMPGHLKAEVMQLHTLWMLIQDEETNLEVLKQKLDRAHEESVAWYRTARALKGVNGREKEREEALAMRRTHIAEIRRIEPLMTATKQQLADDYASIVEQFADRIMVGRAAQKRKIDEERKYAQRFGIEALKDVDTGRDRKTYEYSAEEKMEKKKDQRLRDIRLSMHGSLKYMIESVSTNAIGGRGFIYHEMILGDNGWVACRDNELQMNIDCNLEILKRANTAGFKTVDDMRRAFDDRLLLHDGTQAVVTYMTERTGAQKVEKVPLTVGNATYLVLMWNQPDVRPTLERMNINEETIMELHEMLPAYAKNFIEWSVDMLEERLEKVYSPASVQMYGTSMDKNLNYFPVRRVKEDTYHAPVDITDPNVAPDDNKKVVNTSTALIRRKANLVSVQILVNPMEVLGKHLEEMNHFATFVPFTRNANILLSAPGFREQLDMQDEWGHGLNTYDNFKQAVLVAAGNYQPATDKISKVLNEVQGLVAAGKIAWRYFTAAKQILSLPAFASYSTDPKYWKIFTKNILTTAWWKRGESGRMSTWKWCYENLPTYKQRWDSKYAGDEKLSTVEATAMARALDRSMAGRAIKDFFGKYGMLANAAVDAFTCSIGAYSIYEYELQRYQNEEGMSKEEADKMAKRRAEIGFNQSQQSSELLFLAPSQLDKTFAATYASLFENSNRAYGRIERVAREQIVRSFDKNAVAKQLDLAKNRYAKKLRDAERARLKAENEKISDFSKRLTEEQIEKAVNEKRAAFDIQAEKMAKRDMNRAKKNAVADVVVFRYLLNILWSISPSLAQSVAFIGSDDDENPESWDWAFWANNILQAHLRNGLGGATIGSILSGFGAQSMLEADLNKLIDTAWGIVVKIDEDGEEKTTIDRQAFWETAKLAYAMGTGINLETFSNMYNAVCMVINDGSLDAEDVALFLNSPKSIIEEAAIRPDEGESQEDYIKRIAFMKGLASKVETAQKKQEMNSEGIVEELTDAEKSALTNLKKWQKNYIDIKTARALGLQWQRNRYNGRVEIPELNKLDKQYKDMLKMLGRTPSLNKVEKEKRYIYPEDVLSRIDEAVERLDVMKRLRNIRGLERGRELNVVKNNDYEALTRQWYDAKKSLVEDWKNYQIK